MQNPASSRKKNIIGYLLFGIFAVVGSYAFKTLSVEPLRNFFHAKDWVKVPCQVEKSEIRRQRGTKNDTYKINIEYRYEYQNMTYTGNNYHFFSFYSSGYSGKKKIIDNYPVGKQFFCYVNPIHPAQSVINRAFDWYLLIVLVPLLFILVGIAGIYTLYKNEHPSRRNLQSFVADDMIILKESSSPIKNFVVLFFICLFWNSCVIIMYNAWWLDAYEQQGSIPIGATVIGAIFAIVGLLLIYGTIYTFLCIFNPTIIMKININKLYLGEHYKIHYTLQGNVQRLSDLSFILRGKEETINSSGKNRQTDEYVFCENTFFHQDKRNLSSSGEAVLNIPADIMPSFSSQNNKIAWTIVARGNISLWPDMNHEFPITIYPNQ